jgi:site-specific recombinase XerD
MKISMEDMIKKYLESRKVKGLSPRTIIFDAFALNRFAIYLAAAGLKMNRVTLTHLQAYHAYLQQKYRLCTKGIYSHLTVVRNFCRYCLAENLTLHNPAAKLELPKYPKDAPKKIPTVAQVQQLLAVPDLTTPTGLRSRAIIELAYSAGLRRNEIISLNRADLDLNTRQLRVIGKGDKERVVPFGKSAAYYLKLYLQASRGINPKQPALFQTRRGTRLNKNNLNQYFEAYNRRLGFNFSFHSLRHACALHMLQNKAGIRYIQELLGHECIRTTQIYTRLLPIDLKKVHCQTHPREKEALRYD